MGLGLFVGMTLGKDTFKAVEKVDQQVVSAPGA